MTIMVIDGQGGKMGKGLVEQLKKLCPEDEILAIGTNSIATAAMLKSGADARRHRGEPGGSHKPHRPTSSSVPWESSSLIPSMGEITPKMAVAIGQSPAKKVLIPVNRCQHFVVGCRDISMGEYVKLAVEEVLKIRRGEI